MSKKTFIAAIVLAVLAIGAVTGYFVLTAKKKTTVPSKALKEEEMIVTADVLYEDAAGFSFKHPKETKVADVTPDDDEYYTQLTLTKGGTKLTVTAKDTAAKNVDGWLKLSSEYSSADLVGATTLGGISAKQYAKREILITVAIDQGVVYLIEGPKDDGFWEEVQNAVVSTLGFAGTASAAGGSAGSDIIYEEEEVIE